MTEIKSRKRSMYQQILLGLAITVAFMVLVPFILKWTGGGPKGLGWTGAGLKPCEESPNCICSEDPREKFQTDRISLAHPADPRDLARELATLPNTTIVKVLEGPMQDTVYGDIPEKSFLVHLEFRTPLVGYVDDFQIAGAYGASLVQVRSSSRAGYSDLGVNSKRVEMIREHLKKRS